MENPTEPLGERLRKEAGMPGIGVSICRPGRDESHMWNGTVESFLLMPEHQSGTWLIDGGWGGPPGPIHVRWTGVAWESGGFCGASF